MVRDPTLVINEIYALMKELNEHPNQDLVDESMDQLLEDLDEMESGRRAKPN